MKKVFFAISLLGFIFLSCKKDEISKNETSNQVLKSGDEEPIPPTFESNLPAFPVEALYLIEREYVTFMDNSSLKSRDIYYGSSCISIDNLSLYQYMEIRLLTLYPETAYVGLVEEMNQETSSAIQIYNEYLQDVRIWEQSQGIDTVVQQENNVINSIEDLINIMDMTPEEATYIRSFDSLAINPNYATTVDINNLIIPILPEQCYQKASPVVPFLIISGLATYAGVYAYSVALVCKKRALEKESEFYPNPKSGSKSDAFRHIYVNMLLRRYLTEASAWFIMDVFWEGRANNVPRDKYMDLHNNYVGRHTQYSLFRGNWANDMYNWTLWADRVRYYISNETSNGSLKTWTTGTSLSTIKSEEKSTSKHRYIWYQ